MLRPVRSFDCGGLVLADPEERARDTMDRITRAAGVAAVDDAQFFRDNLGRLMRRAVALGVRRRLVIALSVLPVEEAEPLLDGDLTGCCR